MRTKSGGSSAHLSLIHIYLLVGHDAGAEGVHHDGDGLCHADGVSHLHLALLGQTSGHDVLSHPYISQSLENTKFVAGELSLRLSLMLYLPIWIYEL